MVEMKLHCQLLIVENGKVWNAARNSNKPDTHRCYTTSPFQLQCWNAPQVAILHSRYEIWKFGYREGVKNFFLKIHPWSDQDKKFRNFESNFLPFAFLDDSEHILKNFKKIWNFPENFRFFKKIFFTPSLIRLLLKQYFFPTSLSSVWYKKCLFICWQIVSLGFMSENQTITLSDSSYQRES